MNYRQYFESSDEDEEGFDNDSEGDGNDDDESIS